MKLPRAYEDQYFEQSPLRFFEGRRGSRRGKAMRQATRNTEGNKRLFCALMDHLRAACDREGVAFDWDVHRLVKVLSNTWMKKTQSWEWLLRNYELAHPEVFEDRSMYAAAAFMRGQLCAAGFAEDAAKAVAENRVAFHVRQQQFATERRANGGDVEFFNSAAWQRLRYEVLSESDGKCCLCGRCYREDGVALEVDHIKPRSRFPNLSLEKSNLQVLCFDCNRGKGNRDITDWRSSKAA